MVHYCNNHPAVKATKRCACCKKYICAECAIPFLERYFCSWSCLVKALHASLRALFQKDSEKTSIFQRRTPINFASLCNVGLVLLCLAAFAISFYKIHQDTLALHQEKIAGQTIETFYEPDITGSISEKPDAMVLSNQIRMCGEAADSLIISLKVNGELIDVTLPEDGRFEFPNITLGVGANSIRVLALDTRGNVKELQNMVVTYGSPRLTFLARDVIRGGTARPNIALTFDGGAGNDATDAILDILREKQCRCTMFLTGGFIKRYPEQVKRMLNDGHEIGNHTWSHPHLTSFADTQTHTTRPDITRDKLHAELLNTAKLFNKLTDTKIKPYWRAPFGEHNAEIRLWAAELGYQQIGWTYGRGESMDSMDWVADTSSASYKSADEILQKLLTFGEKSDSNANGSIVLMHLDTQRREDQVFHIIPAFVDSMRARGYKFKTISELLRHSL